jgi:hypothetical protein
VVELPVDVAERSSQSTWQTSCESTWQEVGSQRGMWWACGGRELRCCESMWHGIMGWVCGDDV